VRNQVVSYVSALDDTEFDELVTQARGVSKDAAAARISAILKQQR